MDLRVRLGAGAAAALLLLALTACGGSKGTTASSATATSSRATTAATATRAPKPMTSASSAGGATGAKTCPGGDASGVIGGKAKCLHAGQECSQKHAADYVQYGFTCTQQGQKYVLAKK